MKIIDLTHILTSTMPVFDESEQLSITPLTTIKNDGFKITNLNIFSHNGTHIDAPSHILENGKSLNDFPLEKFIGQAIVINTQNSNSNVITLDLIKNHITTTKSNFDFIIFNTGFHKHFNNDIYLTDYPYLSSESAKFISLLPIKGVGFDTISLDSPTNHNLTNHKIFLENEIILIENLTNLDSLPDDFILSILPLSYNNSDGSPVRACALLNI